MQEVVMDRVELLGILRDNREKHKKVYIQMVKKYQTAVIKNLKTEAERIEKEQAADRPSAAVNIKVAPPQSFLAQYDRAIKMLSLDTRQSVPLSEHEFDQYVLDKWGWQRSYTATLTSYGIGAATRAAIASAGNLAQSLERQDLYEEKEPSSDDLLALLSEEDEE